MSAYLIALVDVTDMDQYRKYMALSPAIVAKFGGRFLTRGGRSEVLEGEPDSRRKVLLEFPDTKSAEAWFNDPDYQAALKFRHASAVTHMLLLQDGGTKVLNNNK